jgi:hypothetical protein
VIIEVDFAYKAFDRATKKAAHTRRKKDRRYAAKLRKRWYAISGREDQRGAGG